MEGGEILYRLLTEGIAQQKCHLAGGKLFHGFCFCLTLDIRTCNTTGSSSLQVIAVGHGVGVALTNNATKIAVAVYFTHIVAILHSATIAADHAADPTIAADLAEVIAILHSATIAADHAAGTIGCVTNIAYIVAVFYQASVIANDAAAARIFIVIDSAGAVTIADNTCVVTNHRTDITIGT